jgi:hypothetical protein
MKNCSRCKEFKPLERFSVNDYGAPVSQCKDCQCFLANERASRKREAKLLLNQSGPNTTFASENAVRKCKDFFFYE